GEGAERGDGGRGRAVRAAQEGEAAELPGVPQPGRCAALAAAERFLKTAAATASAPGGERRTPDWDRRQGTSNFLALVRAQVASGGLAFAATWLATRVLGVGGYGGLAAILAASQITGQIVLEWSSVSLWRYGCEEFVQTGRITAAFWTRLMVLGAN